MKLGDTKLQTREDLIDFANRLSGSKPAPDTAEPGEEE